VALQNDEMDRSTKKWYFTPANLQPIGGMIAKTIHQ